MGRKNRRKGFGKEIDLTILDDLLIPEHFTPPQPSPAELAYAHAVEVCDRIIRELDKELEE